LYIVSNLSLKPSGIGRQTAISFTLEGCRSIAICDRNLEGLVETEKFMKDVSQDVDVLIPQVDMLEAEQIDQMVVATVSKWGRLDYAINAAGENFFSLLSPNRNYSGREPRMIVNADGGWDRDHGEWPLD
jgi:NAD(P)-dependent dehydrogenase (short-subunit alcohol dehydrogenase family)